VLAEALCRPLVVHPPLSYGDVPSGLDSGPALLVDLELVHTQPLDLKLLDLEPPGPPHARSPDAQREGADRASPDRRRPHRNWTNANRTELLRATPASGGPTEGDL
jgi:hypothetical protein